MHDELDHELDHLETTVPWEWPELAKNTIRRALRSPNDVHRHRGAGLASQVLDDELALRLTRMVADDHDVVVQEKAAIILGRILEACYRRTSINRVAASGSVPLSEPVYQQVTQLLETSFRNPRLPETVRRRVLESAVRAPRAWHSAAIRAAYLSSEQSWKKTGLYCMGFAWGFEKEILAELQSHEPECQREAIVAATNLGLHRAIPALLALAASEMTDVEVRVAAIEALVMTQGRESLQLLCALTEHADAAISEAAQATLVRLQQLLPLEQET